MKNICIVVYDELNHPYDIFIKRYLGEFIVSVQEAFPSDPSFFDLVVLLGHRKIIPNLTSYKNVILFHTSDLPKGRGWAPLYDMIANNHKYYVLSCLKPNDQIDGGDIILKAKFEIPANATASTLRRIDNELCILLIRMILEKYPNGQIKAKPQKLEESTFLNKRTSDMNEIPIDSKISDVFHHLRACEPEHPAFFYYGSTKFEIHLRAVPEASFPPFVEIWYESKRISYIKTTET